MLKDLDDLQHAGIITADTAEQIRQYYQSKQSNSGNRFNALMGILGALLVGAGIVLVVAHNWDDLNKTTRTIFAFLPLVLGQALCAYSLFRKKDSLVWRESSAVILFFGVAAAIALVNQVYQVSGTLDDFILTWLLMTAPLVYIMNSSATSLLIIAAATWYGYLVGYDSTNPYGNDSVPWYYLAFLIFLVPHYYRYARHNCNSYFFHIHNWFLSISLIINLGTINTLADFEWGSAVYVGMFSVFYLIGNARFFKDFSVMGNPFLVTGLLGIVFMFMIWSFDVAWYDFMSSSWKNAGITLFAFHYALILLLLFAAILIVYNYRKDKKSILDPVGFSAFLFLACIIPGHNNFSVFFMNCWVLVLGIYFIRKGSRQNHFGILNLGLLFILLLAVLRFFDDGIPFIWRGIFFVAAGAGFFAANYLMLRKRKAVTQNNNA